MNVIEIKDISKADHLGINESVEAVCFPAGCATAASFDRELVRTLGEIIGEECQARCKCGSTYGGITSCPFKSTFHLFFFLYLNLIVTVQNPLS